MIKSFIRVFLFKNNKKNKIKTKLLKKNLSKKNSDFGLKTHKKALYEPKLIV